MERRIATKRELTWTLCNNLLIWYEGLTHWPSTRIKIELRLLLKSNFTVAVALILNTRQSLLIGFTPVLVRLAVATANFVVLDAVTVLSRRDGLTLSHTTVATVSICKLTELIVLAISVAPALTIRRFTRLIHIQIIRLWTVDGTTAGFAATGRKSVRTRPAFKIRWIGAIVASSHASSSIITHGHERRARVISTAARRMTRFVTFVIRGTRTDAAARHSVLGHGRRFASWLI